MSRLCKEDKNTEAQRTQSFASRLSSVISVISVPLCFCVSVFLCFKNGSPDHGEECLPRVRQSPQSSEYHVRHGRTFIANFGS